MLPVGILGENYYGCPRRPVKDDPGLFGELAFYHSLFSRGFLPDPGAVNDQAARGMRLITMFDSLLSEAERQARDGG